jgi:hypothetical protein
LSRTCPEVRALIDDLVDGTLDDERARAVRGHARTCLGCAQAIDATEQLVEAAATLEPLEAPSSLWEGISARLDEQAHEDADRPTLWWRWRAWRTQILAGLGGLAVVAVIAILLSRKGEDVSPRLPEAPQIASVPGSEPVSSSLDMALRELARAEADYGIAVRQLAELVQLEKPHWRPDVTRAFDENLATIDEAIERQRVAAHAQPGDLQAQDVLYGSLKKKIDFLQESIVRAEIGAVQ